MVTAGIDRCIIPKRLDNQLALYFFFCNENHSILSSVLLNTNRVKELYA